MAQALKAALIGCGNIGARYDEREPDGRVHTHAGMYRSTGAFEFVAAAEPVAGRRRAFRRFWGVQQTFSDHRELLARVHADILSVATPDHTHAAIVGDALRSEPPPRLIFCEKPLATNAAQAVALVREARRRNVTVCVDYIRRWDDNHRRLKRWLQDGGLGPLEAVTGYYVRGLGHNGCQLINLIRYLFGRVETVQATGPVYRGSVAGDPSLDLCLKMESGPRVRLTALDQEGYGFSIFELDVFGKKGRLRLLEGGQQAQLFTVRCDGQFPNFNKLHPADFAWDELAYGQAMVNAGLQMAAFMSSPSAPLDNEAGEALADLMVIEAARASACDGGNPRNVQPGP